MIVVHIANNSNTLQTVSSVDLVFRRARPTIQSRSSSKVKQNWSWTDSQRSIFSLRKVYGSGAESYVPLMLYDCKLYIKNADFQLWKKHAMDDGCQVWAILFSAMPGALTINRLMRVVCLRHIEVELRSFAQSSWLNDPVTCEAVRCSQSWSGPRSDC